MNNQLQTLKKYVEANTKETINLINKKLGTTIKNLTAVEEIETNKVFSGIKLIAEDNTIFLTICNKKDANELAYKYWAYFCILNKEDKDISLLDEIDMNSYSKETHHDIMEISNKAKEITIKMHYIVTPELLEKELITQDELLVIIL